MWEAFREFVGGNFAIVEVMFTAAVALGFGGYQLWSINREIARDQEKKAERERASGE
jgi:hypothetical protein